jgi:hypothetical protein
MSSYKRRVVIERFVSAVDTTGDGILDSITLLTTDKYIPIVLEQSVKDIGVYTDYDDTKDTVEIPADTLWNDYNDGSNDGGTDPTSGGVSNPYVEGEVANTSSGTVTIEGCTDPLATNYYSLANVPCNGDNSCCEYPFGGFSGTGGGGGGSTTVGSCHRLGSGWISSNWSSYASNALNLAKDWCKGVASACGGAYPIINGCGGNGCGGSTCCPGPTNSHVLLGTSGSGCEAGQDCSGTACCQSEPFEGIKLVSSQYNSGDGTYYHVWHFYCIPD